MRQPNKVQSFSVVLQQQQLSVCDESEGDDGEWLEKASPPVVSSCHTLLYAYSSSLLNRIMQAGVLSECIRIEALLCRHSLCVCRPEALCRTGYGKSHQCQSVFTTNAQPLVVIADVVLENRPNDLVIAQCDSR